MSLLVHLLPNKQYLRMIMIFVEKRVDSYSHATKKLWLWIAYSIKILCPKIEVYSVLYHVYASELLYVIVFWRLTLFEAHIIQKSIQLFNIIA
jgi:hypothetical protein